MMPSRWSSPDRWEEAMGIGRMIGNGGGYLRETDAIPG